MKCPFCGNIEDKVIDSRQAGQSESIRRRRECLKCQRRFTTYEHVERSTLMVVKKDGRREPFDRNKILNGIHKACEKRPVGEEQLDELVDDVERTISRAYDKEVPAKEIGDLLMRRLQKLDEVAYVRFASVYRQFRDIGEFMQELRGLLKAP